jgi:hypothetical protein
MGRVLSQSPDPGRPAGIEPATIGSEGWPTRVPRPATCDSPCSRSRWRCPACSRRPQFPSRLASRPTVVRAPQPRSRSGHGAGVGARRSGLIAGAGTATPPASATPDHPASASSTASVASTTTARRLGVDGGAWAPGDPAIRGPSLDARCFGAPQGAHALPPGQLIVEHRDDPEQACSRMTGSRRVGRARRATRGGAQPVAGAEVSSPTG